MAENIELKNNLMSFRETFREYTDCYTVIGGTACMILRSEKQDDKDIIHMPRQYLPQSHG